VPFGDILAILFWPLAALFVLLCWKFGSNSAFKNEGQLAFVWLAMPFYLIWSLLGFSSLIGVFNFHLGLIFAAVATFYYFVTSIRRQPGPEGNRARLILVLMGSVFLVWGGWYLAGDHLMARETAEGRIQDLGKQINRGFPADQIVTINDHEYKLTRHLRATLKVGDHVRIEVGQGSGYIYRLEHVPAR